MEDVVIFYHSEHHGNTKKLLEGIAQRYPVELIEVPTVEKLDLTKYKVIGFASGVYLSQLHHSLFDCLDEFGPLEKSKEVFILYTSGSGGKKYADTFIKKLKEKGLALLGVYHCRGYDTYGPFKLIGGIAKGRPDQVDIAAALHFYEEKILVGSDQG
jgi:flavodoxin